MQNKSHLSGPEFLFVITGNPFRYRRPEGQTLLSGGAVTCRDNHT